MASILLASAGGSLGTSLGLGVAGSFAGKIIGSQIGGFIDNQIFGPRRLPDQQGRRLEDLAVQTSTYGKAIPQIFGSMRLAGNIIWAQPIKETSTTTTQSSGKGGGGRVEQKQTSYAYSVSLAIAICDGEIDDVIRVWADSKIIDSEAGTYRLYKGDETQLSDTFIESFEGAGNAPAYRGLAYVVIEDFPLADYGNRIPNFTFEVKRKVASVDAELTLEERIKSVVIIPGSGEFVYDTEPQKKVAGQYVGTEFTQGGKSFYLNLNNNTGKTDALVALDQMQRELSNLEWVSVVVGWFGNSLDAGACTIRPGVEFNTGATTQPQNWGVSTFNRSSAYLISSVDDRPTYGGTPDDTSLVRLVDELKARGLKVMIYPFIFMDIANKPWRGRVTGSTTDVANFFTKTNGYNAFVNHYANLLNGKADAFCIGSEMIGLTKIRNTSTNAFPAVSALVSLAASVKGIMGSSTKVTYAADWSEYHHTDGGWFNLDPLWASPNIDMIGIDAYFPLTDAPQTGYDKQEIVDGWTQGEGYDWYYSDVGRTTQTALTTAFAWKNLAYWWSNTHTNPVGGTTAWVPNSKKIWFTEFGFPSVDGCANQPNVFYDPNSSESAFPYHSKGRVDFRAQRVAMEGTLDAWDASSMVERMFAWCWDARPYPYYPDLRDVWADGNLWMYGHWLNGKLGLSQLSAIVAELCAAVGLQASDIDVSALTELVDGYSISAVAPARHALEQLQNAFFFDVKESDVKLVFLPRGQEVVVQVAEAEIIPKANSNKLVEIKRKQEIELPKNVDVTYINRILDYQTSNQHAMREVTTSQQKLAVSLSLVLNEWQARKVAEVSLYNAWVSRNSLEFGLPVKYSELEPNDVIEIELENATYQLRLTEVMQGVNGEIRVKAVTENVASYDFYAQPQNSGAINNQQNQIAEMQFTLLDIPAMPNDSADVGVIRMAATLTGGDWLGAGVYRSDDNGDNYARIASVENEAIQGTALNALASFTGGNVFDYASTLQVLLLEGELESRSELAVLNGANATLLGSEIIQFKTATLIGENKYELSGLLRGRLGTESAINGHIAGEKFVLLEERLQKLDVANSLIGYQRKYKAAHVGELVADVATQDFTYTGQALKPYSPVQVTGVRDGSGNLTINWVRRARVNAQWRDSVDVPLDETTEAYEVEIMNGASVARLINASTTTASYSAAQQVTDFGSAQASVDVRIYQISTLVGRGKPSMASV